MLATVVGTDADPDEMSQDGAGATETTIVGEMTAGAIAGILTAAGGTVSSATTATGRTTGVLGGATIDGETLVSVTMSGAIVLVVEFNIGITGVKLVPIAGREVSKRRGC